MRRFIAFALCLCLLCVSGTAALAAAEEGTNVPETSETAAAAEESPVPEPELAPPIVAEEPAASAEAPAPAETPEEAPAAEEPQAETAAPVPNATDAPAPTPEATALPQETAAPVPTPAPTEEPEATVSPAPAPTAGTGTARAIIGADLTEAQIETVYRMFGVSRGSVPEMAVTNADERQYLASLVDSSVIGTKAISSAYIETLPSGQGLQIDVQNLTWITREMIASALTTSGIYDAKIIVAAPFAVSGTAALTGIYKAYENLTGDQLAEIAKQVATQELVVTGELATQIGSYDAVTIVNDLKLVLDETKNMSDDELREQISSIAQQYSVSLTDSQIDQLINLCRQLEKMSSEELKEKVESLQGTIKKLSEATEKVSGFSSTVSNIVESVKDIIKGIISFFKR